MQNTEPCSDTEHLNEATSFIFQTPRYCAGTQHNTVFSVSKDTVRQRDKQDTVWATRGHTNGCSSMGRERRLPAMQEQNFRLPPPAFGCHRF